MHRKLERKNERQTVHGQRHGSVVAISADQWVSSWSKDLTAIIQCCFGNVPLQNRAMFTSLPGWLLTVCIWTISRKNRLTHTVEPVSCLSCFWIKNEVSKSTDRSKSHRFPSIKSLASKHIPRHLCALPGKKFRSGYNIPGCAFTAGAEEMASSIIAVRNKCQVGN